MPNNTNNLHEEVHRELFDILADLSVTIKQIEVRSIERDKKVDDMYETFTKANNVAWFVKWLFGIFVAIAGFILMVKSIINGNN